jgi:hypothetical protein
MYILSKEKERSEPVNLIKIIINRPLPEKESPLLLITVKKNRKSREKKSKGLNYAKRKKKVI